MPIRSVLISKEVRLLGEKRPAHEIIKGTYKPPVGTDYHTMVMINLLHISDKLLDTGPIEISVSSEYVNNMGGEQGSTHNS